MVDNCSIRNSNWEIDDWMVRTEIKNFNEKEIFSLPLLQIIKIIPKQIQIHIQLKKIKINK